MSRARRLYNRASNTIARASSAIGLGPCLYLRPVSNLKCDEERPRLIDFLCKGNICRSAYAHAKLQKALAELHPNGEIEVASAGLDTTPGKPANPQALQEARERGVDLSAHLTRSADAQLLDKADLIAVMEPYQVSEVRRVAPESASRTFLLGALTLPYSEPLVISDPFGKPQEEFQTCFDQIDKALEALLESL